MPRSVVSALKRFVPDQYGFAQQHLLKLRQYSAVNAAFADQSTNSGYVLHFLFSIRQTLFQNVLDSLFAQVPVDYPFRLCCGHLTTVDTSSPIQN